LVRFDAGDALQGEELHQAARALLRGHLARRPAGNPFERFGRALQRDLPRLLEGEAEDYHAYAFATVRMIGSAAEVASSHVQWLLGEAGLRTCAALGQVVDATKVLSFRLARRRAFDPQESVTAMAGSWEQALNILDDALERDD
jgi:hypothetical protein